MEIAPPPPDPPPGGGRMPHTHYAPVMGVAPRTRKRRRHGESYIAVGVPLTESQQFGDVMTYTSGSQFYVPYHLPPNLQQMLGDFATVYDVRMMNAAGLTTYRESPQGRVIQTAHTASTPVAEGVPVPRQTRQSTAGRVLPSFVGDPYDPTSRWGPSIQEWSPL